MGMLTKRSTVLGLPIGPQRMAWERLAMMGGAAAVAAAGQQGIKRARNASESLKEPIEQGKKALSEASEIGEDVEQITGKMSGGGGGGGLLGKAASVFTGGGGGGGNGGGEGGDGTYTKKLRLVTKLAQDVAVPRQVAYNQWTQYEDWPEYMKGVVSVEPEDEVTQKWTAKIGPSRRSWTATVQEQVPDERIQWEASEGVEHFGVVTFHELDDNLTRVQVEMEYHASGFVEKVGNLFLTVRRKTRKELRLFKHYMELQNEETGAWRGEIADGEVVEGGEGEGEEEEQEQAGARDGEGKEEREEEAASAGGGGNGDGDRGRASGERAGQEAAGAESQR